jgi:FdhE protein
MSMDHDTEKRHLERKLKHLNGRDYIPGPMLELLSKVAQRQLEARSKASVQIPQDADLPETQAHVMGKPMLPASEFVYDREQYESLFKEFLEYMRETGGHLENAAETIRKDMESGELDVHKAAHSFLDAEPDYFEEYAKKIPDAPSALSFLVQASLTPSLEALAQKLNEKRDSERIWEHGTCPVCGGLPLIGRLKEKEGFKHLTCAFCHTEYRVPRISCPYCGEREQQNLLLFDSPDEPGFKVETCKSCKMYIKTADFRDLDRISLPLFDDLESLPMDVLAREEGYTRPTVSGWGF